MGTYSVHPTGTTIYDPAKAYNGYTVFHAFDGAVVLDMNGRVIHEWKGLNGSPSRLLPGGYMMGTVNQPVIAARFEGADLPEPDLTKEEMLEVDWDGNVTWRKHVPQHHDYQIGRNPVGYYVPGMPEERPEGNSLLVLANCIGYTDRAPGQMFIDDEILEYNEKGEKVWSWKALDHLDDFGLSEDGITAVLKTGGDWCHLNAVSRLGENRHYDTGDQRFAPENIIVSSRELSIVFIVDRRTGEIVLRHGPADVEERLKERAKLGFSNLEKDDPGLTIGQHHAHMIPKGLPGEGNILLYDNGGFSGFDSPSVLCPDGRRVLKRHYSRVLELDPVTWKIVWQYQYDPLDITASGLFSPLLGSAQRLPNGNTLVTEGVFGRIMEIAPDGEIVWEYISCLTAPVKIMGSRNIIYRAYRVPYGYLPFVEKPEEIALPKIENFSYRVPGSVSESSAPAEKIVKCRTRSVSI